jgi:hypothetical protein
VTVLLVEVLIITSLQRALSSEQVLSETVPAGFTLTRDMLLIGQKAKVDVKASKVYLLLVSPTARGKLVTKPAGSLITTQLPHPM